MKTLNNLKKLLLPSIEKLPNIFFKKIILDSRKVTQGDLFIAVQGSQFHGKKFIPNAISNGAKAILVETYKKNNHGRISTINNTPIIYFLNLSQNLSAIAGNFYQNPGKKLVLIGVTGTNGKTTVTHLIAQWIHCLRKKSAIIGTLGNGIYNSLKETKNTTDSAIKIQMLLNQFLKKKLK